MVWGTKYSQMVTNTKVNMSMVYLKESGSITGVTVVSIKEILNKE